MLLYHYSNEDLELIEPKHFGSSHTPHSEIPRSYYYVNPDYREKFFLGARFRYTVGIGHHRIYDCLFDDKGLFSRYSGDDLLIRLKKLGYIGFRFKLPNNHEVVCLFNAQRPIKKESL